MKIDAAHRQGFAQAGKPVPPNEALIFLVIAVIKKLPANHENIGRCQWLPWAGTEARPTKRKALPETGFSDNWQLYFLGNCHDL